jgi:hypothetical protein
VTDSTKIKLRAALRLDAGFGHLRATGSRFRLSLTEAEKGFVAESIRRELLGVDGRHWRFGPNPEARIGCASPTSGRPR